MGVNFCFSPILHQHQQEKFLQQIDIHSTAMEATWQSDGSHRNQNMFKNWQNYHHGLHAIINCTADLHKVAVRQSLEPAGWSKCPCLKNTQFLLETWPKNIGRIYVPAWPLVAKFTGRVALNQWFRITKLRLNGVGLLHDICIVVLYYSLKTVWKLDCVAYQLLHTRECEMSLTAFFCPTTQWCPHRNWFQIAAAQSAFQPKCTEDV